MAAARLNVQNVRRASAFTRTESIERGDDDERKRLVRGECVAHRLSLAPNQLSAATMTSANVSCAPRNASGGGASAPCITSPTHTISPTIGCRCVARIAAQSTGCKPMRATATAAGGGRNDVRYFLDANARSAFAAAIAQVSVGRSVGRSVDRSVGER